MYTGTQARDWNALRAQGAAAVQRAEAGLPWELEGPRASTDQETWLISFIDILTLLLTLFVLLLAYQKHEGEGEAARHEPVVAKSVTARASPVADSASEQATVTVVAVPSPVVVHTDRQSAVHETQSAETANVSGTVKEFELVSAPQTFATQADSSPASLYLMGRASESVPGNPRVTAQTHPLMWLNDVSVTEPAPEPTAIAAARPEPTIDPKQRLLAELERSELAGRIEVSVLPDAVNLEISDNILFTPASAALTAGGRGLLDELATTLKTLPYALSVEGHTDNVPIRTARYPSNWELASARAGTVTRHLIEQGIAAERVRAIGYADTRPRAENTTPEGRARNRRVSFILRLPAQ